MKLSVLGSGTYQPELERHSSSYLIETDNGQKLCFDFGRGTIDQLLKLNIQITEIDAVFLSHWHGDHVADLISLLHYTTAPLSEDISIIRPVRKKPIKIYGPKATLKNIKQLLGIIRYGKNKLNNLEIVELVEDNIIDNDWVIKSFLAEHKPNALAYRLETDGKILAYSGDSVDCLGLRKAVNNADLAIMEASWPQEIDPKTHSTGQMAGKIAQAEGVKKLILTHISPYYLKNYNPKKDAQKYFKGEIIIAKDLLQIKV